MAPRLEDYDRKRDFSSTPEPAGREAPSPTGRLYVFHKHAARSLHYDLRLEHDGALLSWAVPKGPSLDPKQRRLAVHVEDHPVDYGSFEGVIPEGEYGAGTVMLWDRGTWAPHGDVDEALGAGKLVFDLEGEKLTGRFALIHTGARRTGREQNQWLLIKEKDPVARPHDEFDVTAELPLSAETGRSLEEIAEAGDDDEEDADAEPSAAPLPDAATLPGAVAAPLPAEPRPQLASTASHPPEGDEWIHEIKYDGYRLLFAIEGGNARAITREGHDWTDRFPSLSAAIGRLPVRSAVLDAEAVLPATGAGSFGELTEALKEGRERETVAVVFDLPYLDGRDLSDVPLLARKAALRALVSHAAEPRVRFSDHIEGPRAQLLDRACDLGAEGLISKHRDAAYRPGRSGTWVKSKCVYRQEFLVVGYTDPRGERKGPGALLLAYRDSIGGDLVYAGRVGSGMSEAALADLESRLASLARDEAPLDAGSVDLAPAHVHWIEPDLVVEVSFTEWTKAGRLRHPVFRGVRDDKEPASVVREAVPTDPEATETLGSATVLGVALSHADRVMVSPNVTKLDLARYYESAAPHVLRHLAGRPLTLLRCPDGYPGECFWQRHIEPGTFPHVSASAEDGEEFVTLTEPEGLVELVQYLVVEFHVWGSLSSRADRPDRLVFDLDPGPGVDWDTMRAGALLVREVLEGEGLVSFLKTSGGKGLHVVAPIEPKVPVADASQAAKAMAQKAVAVSGGRMTIDPRKANRTGKIFLDWHRNGAAQSTVAAYSVRARQGAPVSTPVTWEELREGFDPAAFTPETVLERLRATGDPWEDLPRIVQHLPQETLPGT